MAEIMRSIRHRFGHSPWLLDILWRIPAGENMHQLVRMANEMTHNRVHSDKLSPSKDLLSYLVRSCFTHFSL